MSEYYLATKEKWVLEELEEVYDFLVWSQYVEASPDQPQDASKDRPQDLPEDPIGPHGGWGHNPGFEGYGPICMLTGQGALAFALMKHCGIEVDRERHDAAYDFLERGTGPNGYVWYEDQAAGAEDWADMGRTGAAGIANFLSPYQDPKYRVQRALAHARVIGEHPESFPDTHGSPIMGMGYAALAANVDPRELPPPDGRQPLVVRPRPVPRRQLLLPAQPRQRRLRRGLPPLGHRGHRLHLLDPQEEPAPDREALREEVTRILHHRGRPARILPTQIAQLVSSARHGAPRSSRPRAHGPHVRIRVPQRDAQRGDRVGSARADRAKRQSAPQSANSALHVAGS